MIIAHTIRDVQGKAKKYAKAYTEGPSRTLTPYKTEFYRTDNFTYASVWAVDKNGKTYQTNYSSNNCRLGYWVPTNYRGNHYKV